MAGGIEALDGMMARNQTVAHGPHSVMAYDTIVVG
jgi:hypothetical protein